MTLALPRLIGHRGAAAHAPENTLAGLKAAKALGLAWVEFDVMLSWDGEPVLMHDESLKRTTGLWRDLCQTSLAELRELDAGAWFSEEFVGERVPSLLEALDCLAELGLGANVEIKPTQGLARATASSVAVFLKRHWPKSLPPPLVSSFDPICLEVAKFYAPELPRGYLVEELPADWAATAQRLGCATVHPWHEPLRPEQVQAIKAEGYSVAVYTVNEAARGAELLAWGVDSLITDDPAALASLP